jgi:hypothetical protein
MRNKTTIFEDFLNYCDEDNSELRAGIETWLADYFDLYHRLIPLDKHEKKWILENLTPESQLKILGTTLKSYLKRR